MIYLNHNDGLKIQPVVNSFYLQILIFFNLIDLKFFKSDFFKYFKQIKL